MAFLPTDILDRLRRLPLSYALSIFRRHRRHLLHQTDCQRQQVRQQNRLRF
jgi:hypothetical protein